MLLAWLLLPLLEVDGSLMMMVGMGMEDPFSGLSSTFGCFISIPFLMMAHDGGFVCGSGGCGGGGNGRGVTMVKRIGC